MRVRPREASVINRAHMPDPGEYTQPVKPYVHGATGAGRPKKTDTYEVNDVRHRFDGKCHDDCENVR